MQQLDPAARTFGQARIRCHVLNGPQHQGQRCTKLVTDVRKERRLRAIDLRECFGALTFRLVGLRVDNRRGYLACHQVEKRCVAPIKWPPGTDACDEKSNQPLLPRADEWQYQRALRLSGCSRRVQRQLVNTLTATCIA